MSNRNVMLSALRRYTFPLLAEQGFTGKYPHFRKKRDNCIELISFMTNKWGGSFTVEVSVAFPDAAKKNYTLPDGVSEDALNVFCTHRRERLPGMFDGWFYYRDVYRKYVPFSGMRYHDVPEREADAFTPPGGWTLVQKFNAKTAEQICREVNSQMEQAFHWLEDFERKPLRGKYRILLSRRY